MDVRMRGFKERMRVDDALKLYFEKANLKRLGSEKVDLLNAYNRVLSQDIVAKYDVPHFDRSAVDGYAVKAENTFGASTTNPILLRVVGSVEIGEKADFEIKDGEAVKIATGAPIPKGANAVVMLEYTNDLGEYVEVLNAVSPFKNVSRRGEDVKAGEVVISKGEILQPQDIGILASLGVREVEVVKIPKIAVLTTGNELVELCEELEVGKIVNSNSPMICAAIKEIGCIPIPLGIAKDNPKEIKSKIEEGLRVADAVVITGGTSVGEKDYVSVVVKNLGNLIVHGVSMKPGMPTGLAVINGKPVLLLPGFPMAALLAFYTFMPKIVERLLGIKILKKKGEIIKAIAKRRIPSSSGIRTFARVIYKNGFVEPLRTSGSGIITSMIKANGLVVIEEDKEGIEEGEEVDVTLTRHLIKLL
ncbi:MAG TPA: molybdopterin molybdenumtransferase MoeA [Archaeoglobus veneficus]|nr:molybdopterin molybdenumtransferase MoeA [Archaeoglobus veneficus]